jgi:hypothetical protein
MSPLTSIPALRACEELHVLHPNVFTRKFGLTHVCGLAVPAGASLSDIELAELFTDHGLDRICMPAHEPGLARFPLGDIDLLVFAYDGSPLEMNEHIRVPQWTLGFVYSTMEPVQVTHEEAATLGGDPYVLVTVTLQPILNNTAHTSAASLSNPEPRIHHASGRSSSKTLNNRQPHDALQQHNSTAKQRSRHATRDPTPRSEMCQGFTTGPNQRTSSEPPQQQNQAQAAPQSGFGATHAAAPSSKEVGLAPIFDTHQPDKS